MRFSYRYGAERTRHDSPMNFVHYNPIADRLEQVAEHWAGKEEDTSILKKNWTEDVQLPGKFKDHRPAFS